MKSKLLNPALTSLYYVSVGGPKGGGFRADNDRINLMCCGNVFTWFLFSNTGTHKRSCGTTERHAYRRVYDDRIDLTFYVESQRYSAINFSKNGLNG